MILVVDKGKTQFEGNGRSFQRSACLLCTFFHMQARDWLVNEPCEVIGVLSLQMTLYEIADYPTETLMMSSRRYSKAVSDKD